MVWSQGACGHGLVPGGSSADGSCAARWAGSFEAGDHRVCGHVRMPVDASGGDGRQCGVPCVHRSGPWRRRALRAVATRWPGALRFEPLGRCCPCARSRVLRSGRRDPGSGASGVGGEPLAVSDRLRLSDLAQQWPVPGGDGGASGRVRRIRGRPGDAEALLCAATRWPVRIGPGRAREVWGIGSVLRPATPAVVWGRRFSAGPASAARRCRPGTATPRREERRGQVCTGGCPGVRRWLPGHPEGVGGAG